MLESRREEAEEEGRLYEFRDPFQGPGQARDFAQLSCRDQVKGHRLITWPPVKLLPCSPTNLSTCSPGHLLTWPYVHLFTCPGQVRTLHHLTSMRLEAPDVPERLKDLDPDGE